MKKFRKVVMIFVVILMIVSLTGCTLEPEIKEESDKRARIWCNEGCISIYSPVLSIVYVETTVEYSVGSITIVKKIVVGKDENMIITAQQLNEELFDENSQIISAEIIKQTHHPAATYLKIILWTLFISGIIGIWIGKIAAKAKLDKKEFT